MRVPTKTVNELELNGFEVTRSRAAHNGRHTERTLLALTSDNKYLALVRVFLEEFLKACYLDGTTIYLITQMVDEALSNVIEHGYRLVPGQPIGLEIEMSLEQIVIHIRDRAPAFDPTADPVQSRVRKGQSRGLGRTLIWKIADEVLHRNRIGGGNELILIKKLLA